MTSSIAASTRLRRLAPAIHIATAAFRANTTRETPVKHFKIANLIGTGAIITGALFGAMPSAVAFAACNEGTPNCLPVDAGHQKVQDQLNDAETSGQCAGPDGFCDDEIPGSDVATKPVTIHAPILVTTKPVTTNTR
jgi:hypothetical protein